MNQSYSKMTKSLHSEGQGGEASQNFPQSLHSLQASGLAISRNHASTHTGTVSERYRSSGMHSMNWSQKPVEPRNILSIIDDALSLSRAVIRGDQSDGGS